MSEFLKGMLTGADKQAKESASSTFEDEHDNAFEAGLKAMRQCRNIIQTAAEPYAKRDDYVNAAVVTFVAAWSTIGWLQEGVNRSEEVAKADGRKMSPVKKAWELIRLAFTSGSKEEADAAVAKWAKENGVDPDDWGVDGNG